MIYLLFFVDNNFIYLFFVSIFSLYNRFGEHRGSYCMIATFKDGNKENYIDKINVDAIEKEYLEKAKQVG